MSERRVIAQVGRVTSDLVAYVHALSTEGETGASLDQRVKEIRASANALVLHAEELQRLRNQGESKEAPRTAKPVQYRSQQEQERAEELRRGPPDEFEREDLPENR